MSDIKDDSTVKEQSQSRSCFVIIPISDSEGYPPGHFDRVYNYIIKPACTKAGFAAQRADQNSKTNFIVVDILKQIINSDMAICDLSARNSNVFFELGLRKAFNLKTVLIKDSKTPRSFDISGLRCIDYDESLRVDTVETIIGQLSTSLSETMAAKEDEVYSLVQLLAVEAAKLPDKVTLSEDSSIILREIQRLRENIVKPKVNSFASGNIYFSSDYSKQSILLPNGEKAEPYTKLYQKCDDLPFNDDFGDFIEKKKGTTVIRNGKSYVRIADDDPIWNRLTVEVSSL